MYCQYNFLREFTCLSGVGPLTFVLLNFVHMNAIVAHTQRCPETFQNYNIIEFENFFIQKMKNVFMEYAHKLRIRRRFMFWVFET